MNDEPAKRNIKLVISYDGTDFCGWQRQDGKSGRDVNGTEAQPTIQAAIEAALETMHKHPVPLTGSGRTDSGVHAMGQVANFYTDIASIEAGRFVPALNSLLPRSIRILEAQEAKARFHARFDAKSRLYRYFFVCGREALPAEYRYAARLLRRPDISLLNGYCRFLRGEFDCTVFACPGDKSRSRFRYIYHCGFLAEGDKLVFEIRANAFLWKMVRSIAGTLLFYEEKGIPQEEFYNIITGGRRELAGPTLPPQGLFLWKIEY
jgi:tRNA pseudouridine38-40 synthase